jgi:hypothetical protein
MSSDLVFWLALAVKLALTAGIVVTASVVTERAGPLIGALVMTLPVTVWPAYLFLALDHDKAFLAESAVGGLAVNAVNGIFMLIYAALAQRRSLAISLLVALACWVILAAAARTISWTMMLAVFVNLVVFPICLWVGSGFCEVVMPPTVRRWYDVPLRTLLVCILMATILLISNLVGPLATGFVAVFPISTTSTMLILHQRVGGPVTAAVVANGVWGLVGLSIGLSALHYSIMPAGPVLALTLALAIPVTWNLIVWAARRRRIVASTPGATRPVTLLQRISRE